MGNSLPFGFKNTIKLFQKPIVTGGQKKSTLKENSTQVEGLFHNIDIFEKILGDKTYVTGDNLTIADLAFVSWISTINVTFEIPVEKYPKITAWWKRLEKLPFYEINREGLAVFQAMWAAKE